MLILDISSPMVRCSPNMGTLAGKKKEAQRERGKERRDGNRGTQTLEQPHPGIWMEMEPRDYRTSIGVWGSTISRETQKSPHQAWLKKAAQLFQLPLQNPHTGGSTHLLGGSAWKGSAGVRAPHPREEAGGWRGTRLHFLHWSPYKLPAGFLP